MSPIQGADGRKGPRPPPHSFDQDHPYPEHQGAKTAWTNQSQPISRGQQHNDTLDLNFNDNFMPSVESQNNLKTNVPKDDG